MTPYKPNGTVRAFSRLALAVAWAYAAAVLARRGAHGLVSEDWQPVVQEAMQAFLLLVGFSCFGVVLDGEKRPVSEQGLPLRSGWLGELGMGIAFGWAIAIVCILGLVVCGGIAPHFSLNLVSLEWLFADGAYFAFAALAVQVVFCGYPFQWAIRAVGELPAVLMLIALFAVLETRAPGAGGVSIAVSAMLGLLFALAYLRTRALWLPWGLQFGWLASRALLFGLPVNGVSSHSPAIQGYAMAAPSLSGGDFGLEGSWMALAVMLLALPFVYRATRDLSFVHNAPVLTPAGIPVDLDAAAKRQHEMASRPETPEAKPLVQIMPAASAVPSLAPDLDLRRES